MANRMIHGHVRSLDRAPVELFGRVVVGASGAVSESDCLGFSVERTGVGAYLITLEDKWGEADAGALLFADVRAFGDDSALTAILSEPDMDAKTLAVQFVDDARLPQEVDASATLRIRLTVSNTTAPRKGV
jgi:hypothetical protein